MISDLPLFRATGPFAGLPPQSHLPDPPLADWLAEQEASLARISEPLFPAEHHARAMLADWRARQSRGDVEPRPGCWGEYLLTLTDGTLVTAVVEWPWFESGSGVQHVELHGDVSETGYWSHFFRPSDVGDDLRAWLVDLAESKRRETLEEFAKAQRAAKPKRSKKTEVAT